MKGTKTRPWGRGMGLFGEFQVWTAFYIGGISRIVNYIHYKVWDEITYPFLNFNGATVEV